MSHDAKNAAAAPVISNFLRAIIEADLASGKYSGRSDEHLHPLPAVVTRFPPEPNGYLHIGHAKSICLNFGLARDYAGRCHLRFDDTNPEKEEQEYVDTIIDSVRWLGFSWEHQAEGHADRREHLYYASDYFDQLYAMAEYLIASGHAYVDSQSAEDMAAHRGNFNEPGKNSPYRDRPAAESLDLFRRMKAGEFADGTHVLRAKIDMASPNMNLRDPAIYRIRHAHHHRTGDDWCVYPMYDYAHPLEDAIEHITHSVCTLEFQDHRPFYDWVLTKLWPYIYADKLQEVRERISSIAHNAKKFDVPSYVEKLELQEKDGQVRDELGFTHNKPRTQVEFDDLTLLRKFANTSWEELETFASQVKDEDLYSLLMEAAEKLHQGDIFDIKKPVNLSDLSSYQLPRQYEFARLNLTYVVTSKRKLRQLVEEQIVDGWDDPRMPTIVGIRRRGYTPEAIQLFCERIGVTKSDGWIDYSTLEGCLREDLDPKAPRAAAVLRPLKLVIDNFPENLTEDCSAPVHPHFPERGLRTFPISRELWIEQDDFMETPSKGYFRLFPGNKVRLRYGFVVECTAFDKDENGNVVTVHCNYFPDSKSGTEGSANYKVKGNIHWVSATHALEAEVRLYDRLFTDPQPDAGGKDFMQVLNPNAKEVVTAYLEPGMKHALPDDRYQFERHGYFVADRVDSVAGKPVFNRVVTLKDSWGK